MRFSAESRPTHMAAFGFVLLATADPDRLGAWYREVLPADAIGDVVIDGREDVAARNPEPDRVTLCLHVADAVAFVARLEAHGVAWTAPDERPPGWLATFVDPDGNHVHIAAADGRGPAS